MHDSLVEVYIFWADYSIPLIPDYIPNNSKACKHRLNTDFSGDSIFYANATREEVGGGGYFDIAHTHQMLGSYIHCDKLHEIVQLFT